MSEYVEKPKEDIRSLVLRDKIKRADELYMQNRYDQALPLYKDILARNPLFCRVLSRVGDIYYSREELEKALEFWQKAFECEVDR